MIRNGQFIIGLLLCTLAALTACRQATVELPSHPQRVVSLKPNLTELLFALDAGDRVVGVTTHCIWPEEAKKRPKVGTYIFPDFEKILALKPDLVVTNKESGSPRYGRILNEAGIPVLLLETRTLAGIYEAIAKLGDVLQVDERAGRLRAEIRAAFDAVREQVKEQPRKKALVVIQRRPLIVAGPKTFFSEILATTGAINAVPTDNLAYPRVSMEEILKWQPEVILDIDPSSRIENWHDFRTLPAVKNQQVYFLAPELFFPGPRIAHAAEAIANVLYPKDGIPYSPTQ